MLRRKVRLNSGINEKWFPNKEIILADEMQFQLCKKEA